MPERYCKFHVDNSIGLADIKKNRERGAKKQWGVLNIFLNLKSLGKGK